MGAGTRGVPHEREDFSWLLSELNKKEVCEEAALGMEQPETFAGAVKCDSCYRQKLASNEKIKFYYVKGGRIHSKYCKYAARIKDEKLKVSEEYLEDKKQCHQCALQAYLLIGAEDYKNYEQYKELYKTMKVKEEILRDMYVVKRMKTSLFHNILTIWYKQDRWKIKLLDEQGYVQLSHNNYRQTDSGEREFIKGYHIQNENCRKARFLYAYRIICDYNYEWHTIPFTYADRALGAGDSHC